MSNIIAMIIFLSTAGLALYISYRTVIKKSKNTKHLAATLFSSAAVIIAYSFRLFVTDYLIVSIVSSLQFISIDVTLIFFYRFIFEFTKSEDDKNKSFYRQPITWISLYALFDVVIFVVNIFEEVAISYQRAVSSLDLWKNYIYVLFDLHLAFCYVLVVAISWRLIYKTIKSPSIYKQRYTGILYGLVGIIVFNAIYLVLSDIIKMDVSIMFYSILGTYIYYNVFHYSEQVLIKASRDLIFDEIGRGIVLFDFEDNLTLHNKIASTVLGNEIDTSEEYKLQSFIEHFKFEEIVVPNGKDVSFRWNSTQDSFETGYRVDFKVIKDKHNMTVGHLFVFAEILTDIDLLTGFNSRSTAKKALQSNQVKMAYPASVAICDIIALTEINEKHGTDTGDKAIKLLSIMLKKYCPKDTYFARLKDAYLLCVCPETDRKQMNGLLSQLRFELWGNEELGIKIDFTSAVTEIDENDENMWTAVQASILSMRERKMMDAKSHHSSLLESLARTQTENDPVTEAHVQRTRALGEQFGQRIGLTDLQLSHLNLLCLLHDIGKLGVPLEILNKPSKLNNAEWNVMRSHAEKGYKICMASDELAPIAEMVLHHHECWDGRGYPDKLEGEAIPLLSRVISIVDTYDAMTNDRPYRKRLTKLAARAELRRCAGTQFDPNLVEDFIGMLEEIDPTTKNDLYEQGEYEVDISVPMGVSDIDMDYFKSDEAPIKNINYCKYILKEGKSIYSADENFEFFTGYTPEEAKNMGLEQMDLIFPEDKEDYASLSAFLLGKRQEAYIKHRLKRKDGSFITVNCFGRSFFDSVTRTPMAEIVIMEAGK